MIALSLRKPVPSGVQPDPEAIAVTAPIFDWWRHGVNNVTTAGYVPALPLYGKHAPVRNARHNTLALSVALFEAQPAQEIGERGKFNSVVAFVRCASASNWKSTFMSKALGHRRISSSALAGKINRMQWDSRPSPGRSANQGPFCFLKPIRLRARIPRQRKVEEVAVELDRHALELTALEYAGTACGDPGLLFSSGSSSIVPRGSCGPVNSAWLWFVA